MGAPFKHLREEGSFGHGVEVVRVVMEAEAARVLRIGQQVQYEVLLVFGVGDGRRVLTCLLVEPALWLDDLNGEGDRLGVLLIAARLLFYLLRYRG